MGSLLSTPLINTIHNLLVNNDKGEGREGRGGGLKERGELINFLRLKRVGGLIRGRGLI